MSNPRMAPDRLKAVLSMIKRPELHPKLRQRLLAELKAQGPVIRLSRVSMAELGQLKGLGLTVMLS